MTARSFTFLARVSALVFPALALIAAPLNAKPIQINGAERKQQGNQVRVQAQGQANTLLVAAQMSAKRSSGNTKGSAGNVPNKKQATKPSKSTTAKTAPATIVAAPPIVAPKVPTTTTTTASTPPLSELLVAGASDLRPAFEEIGKLFTAQTGTKVTFSFGSSGQLAQQISNGAPFDVFASADRNYVEQVLASGVGDASTKATYAFGRLALWIPVRTQKRIFNVLDLADTSIRRIAIANPEHAPYGVAALETIKSAKIYELVESKLVFGENVSDAYRLATSGNVDAAVVSLSLVIANNNGGRYIVIPTDAHTPLEQTLIVTAKKPRVPSAKMFTSLVGSGAGRTVMRKYGFLLPGDPKPSNNND